jgi:hydrogenase-4 component F
MNALPIAMLAVLVPVLSALGLPFLSGHRAAAWANVAVAAVTFLLCCALPLQDRGGTWLAPDHLGTMLAILTAFTGLTTAWFSVGYIAREVDGRRMGTRAVRVYHGAFPFLLGTLIAALLSDNIGLTWIAIEAATIAGVLVVGLPATEDAIEASWKYFILCGVAIALSLFGTIMLYVAAEPALGQGAAAMRWSALAEAAPKCNGTLLNLAFVFLLIGYGTKAGLAPLHGWMADAHAEGPTPVSAIMSGAMLNVALSVLLRLRGIMAGNAEAGMGAVSPGPPMMVLGLLSLLVAAFALWQRRDAKRLFAFSSIEQNGVAAFAFGLGGPAAIFAGLLHMVLHTLSKAAVFQCIGRAAQLRGGQSLEHLGGLLRTQKALALTLACAVIAVAGLPPFGLFSSEFLVATATARQAVWLSPLLALGLIVGAWALVNRLQGFCLGEPSAENGPAPGAALLVPAWLHLVLVLVLGLAMPAPVLAWLQDAALLR